MYYFNYTVTHSLLFSYGKGTDLALFTSRYSTMKMYVP